MIQYQVNVGHDIWRDVQKAEYAATPERHRRIMYLEPAGDDAQDAVRREAFEEARDIVMKHLGHDVDLLRINDELRAAMKDKP